MLPLIAWRLLVTPISTSSCASLFNPLFIWQCCLEATTFYIYFISSRTTAFHDQNKNIFFFTLGFVMLPNKKLISLDAHFLEDFLKHYFLKRNFPNELIIDISKS